jgi:signal transduction histidine kinase
MPELTDEHVPFIAQRRARLAALFRLLMLLRVLLLSMAVVLAPYGLMAAAVPGVAFAIGALSLLACRYWTRALPLLLRHPSLLCLDALLAFGLLSLDAAFGPLYLFTVMTSAIAGVFYEWRALLTICVTQIVLGYAAIAITGLVAVARVDPRTTIALSVFYPIAACVGVALRRLLDQYERALRRVESTAAAADERARLAREMHDSLAKTLHGIALSAAALPIWIRTSPDRAEHDARQISSALEIAKREARDLITDLRDDMCRLPLPRAIGNIVAQWERSLPLPVRVRIDLPEACDVPLLVKYEVLSILKESLSNVARHAAARTAVVRLALAEDALELSIRDDGRGFAPPAPEDIGMLSRTGHYGLIGMRERARRVGGRLTVSSAPGNGTVITAVIPHLSFDDRQNYQQADAEVRVP